MANHIYGLSGSGLDVDNLVKEAMKAQRARYDNLYKKKTQLEWKKADYNDFYKDLTAFRNNTIFNYQLQSTLNPKKASTSNSDIVDITASGDAASVNHKLVVNHVAEGVNMTSGDKITLDGHDKSSMANQFGISSQQFNIKLTNGSESKEITVDTSKSIYDLVSSINNAGVHMKATYDTTLDRLFLYTSNTGSTAGIDFSGSSAQGIDFIKNNLKISPFVGESTVSSTKAIDLDAGKVPLAKQFANLSGAGAFDLTFTSQGVTQTVSINPDIDTMSSIAAKINDPAQATRVAAMTYDKTTGKMTIASVEGAVGFDVQMSAANADFMNDLGLPATIPATGATSTQGIDAANFTLGNQFGVGTMTLKLNNASVTINGTDTIGDLVANINTNVTGVTASYINGKLSITAATGKLDFSQNSPAVLNFLTDKLQLPILRTSGQDADITLDGANFTESNNIFTIAGVTYTLKGESATPVTISVTNDIDKVVDNVKSFVDTYNKMLDKLNTAVDEKTYRDYLPLTSDEKSSMKDSDITLWEQKAKSGILHNDSILQELTYTLRDEMSSPISGVTSKYTSVASIGITTGDYSEKGKLYLDEATLRKALQEDPDAVSNLFGKTSDKASEQGIAVKMYDSVKKAIDQIKTTAGTSASADYDTESTVAKEIKDYTDRMSDMTEMLNDLEDSYYKKFDAMETALSKLNQQSSWLTQQLGGGK